MTRSESCGLARSTSGRAPRPDPSSLFSHRHRTGALKTSSRQPTPPPLSLSLSRPRARTRGAWPPTPSNLVAEPSPSRSSTSCVCSFKSPLPRPALIAMEGGGSAGGGGGGGGLYAAQVPRERRQGEEEKEKDGRQPRAAEGAGGMKFRVSARAPHGVGALLLIGGAVLAGAAVVAWRHARRGRRDRHPAKQEAADGGVVEDGKGGASALETDRPDDKVQGGASPREIDQPDDNLRGEEEKTESGSNGLDKGSVTEEIQEVHDDAEIVAEGSVCSSLPAFEFQSSERVEKFDLDLGKSSTEISMHDDVDSEHVEKYDKNSSAKLSEITTHDMYTVTVEKVDENSTTKDTENDPNSTKNDTDNDQDPITNHTENENSSKNELKKQMAPNDNEGVEASDQHSQSISRPGMVLDEQSLHSDGAQEAESIENSPTAKLIMHQEQLLDDVMVDTEGEAAEAKLEKGTVLDKGVPKQGQQQKAMAEPVGLADSPVARSSLAVKPTKKNEPELPGRRIETGMKIQKDYASNGGLKEHDALIGKGGGVVTMDRRSSSSMAILALMFALTIGIAIVVRLYAPLPRATKLQMDLQ